MVDFRQTTALVLLSATVFVLPALAATSSRARDILNGAPEITIPAPHTVSNNAPARKRATAQGVMAPTQTPLAEHHRQANVVANKRPARVVANRQQPESVANAPAPSLRHHTNARIERHAAGDVRYSEQPGATRSDFEHAYEALIDSKDRLVTYVARGGDWFVVSGYIGKRIFYTKSILTDDGIKSFEANYNPRDRRTMDPLVAKLNAQYQ